MSTISTPPYLTPIAESPSLTSRPLSPPVSPSRPGISPRQAHDMVASTPPVDTTPLLTRRPSLILSPVTPPAWSQPLPGAARRGIAQALHGYQAHVARARVYAQRPDVQRTLQDLKHTAQGLAFAFAGASALTACGITAGLSGAFIGQSGIDGLAGSLPWVGPMLGWLIGKGDIYGVAATTFVVETLRRCLMQPQDQANDAAAATWWAFHAACALSMAPLLVAGTPLSGWLVAGALLGAGVCSFQATRVLRDATSPSVDTVFVVCMLAWGLAPMPAHLIQLQAPIQALGAALSVPSLAVMLCVVKNLSQSFAERFNIWSSNDPHLDRLNRQAHFADDPRPVRDVPGTHLVPLLNPPQIASDELRILRAANRNGNDHGTRVLWLSGRPHDGKQEAAAAIANAIGADKPISLDVAHLPPDQRAADAKVIFETAAKSAKRKNRYEVIVIRNINKLLPKELRAADSALRSDVLKTLASSEFARDPRLLFICLSSETGDAAADTDIDIDAATRSRMGTRLQIAAPTTERWKTTLPQAIYGALNRAPTAVALRKYWPKISDTRVLGDVLDALAERGAREAWDMGAVQDSLKHIQWDLSVPFYEAQDFDAAQLPQVQREFPERMRDALRNHLRGTRQVDVDALVSSMLRHGAAHPEAPQPHDLTQLQERLQKTLSDGLRSHEEVIKRAMPSAEQHAAAQRNEILAQLASLLGANAPQGTDAQSDASSPPHSPMVPATRAPGSGSRAAKP